MIEELLYWIGNPVGITMDEKEFHKTFNNPLLRLLWYKDWVEQHNYWHLALAHTRSDIFIPLLSFFTKRQLRKITDNTFMHGDIWQRSQFMKELRRRLGTI